MAIGAQVLLGHDPGDIEANPVLERALYHLAVVVALTRIYMPDLRGALEGRLEEWSLRAWISDEANDVEATWRGFASDELEQLIRNQLRGNPFSDVSKERLISWTQLGVVWRIRSPNTYEAVVAAEQLAATLQIVLADLADEELLLLQTELEIQVSVAPMSSTRIEDVPSNEGRKWDVVVGSIHDGDSVERVLNSALAVSWHLLTEISLHSDQVIQGSLDDLFRGSIAGKVMVGRPYAELYKEFIPEEFFDWGSSLHQIARAHEFEIEPPLEPELMGPQGLAPGYDQEESLSAIRSRYETAARTLRFTFPRLAGDETFKEVLGELRGEGWLDWHLVLAVGNIVWNYRSSPTGDVNPEAVRGITRRLMSEPESEDASPVPICQASLESPHPAT